MSCWQKFQLFESAFGASDEVLGAVESGVDFECRIAVWRYLLVPHDAVAHNATMAALVGRFSMAS